MPLLPVPNDRSRPAYRLNRSTAAAPAPGLQGSSMPGSTGGAVTNGNTYSEVIAVTGAARVRVRIKTVTATGTLNVIPIAPQGLLSTDESVMAASGTIDPAKVLNYATGTGTVAVAAATEAKVDLDLYGESYALVQFVCSANGTITFVDVSQV